jgi:alkylhydroperoxidase/carboxymuconolactone decarboxylase family protein YurZ
VTDSTRITEEDRASLGSWIGDGEAVRILEEAAPSSYDAACRYWRTPFETTTLSPRMTELILLAMHGATSSLNQEAVVRHVRRACAAGATASDVINVMVTIIGQANHSLYTAVPILEEELIGLGASLIDQDADDETLALAKNEFVKARGFWNPSREIIARVMPEYFVALTGISTDSWIHGSLTVKERLLVLIGINSTITHSYEPGLRAHIRRALEHGATQTEILDVFQLAGLMGLEGLVLAARALSQEGR